MPVVEGFDTDFLADQLSPESVDAQVEAGNFSQAVADAIEESRDGGASDAGAASQAEEDAFERFSGIVAPAVLYRAFLRGEMSQSQLESGIRNWLLQLIRQGGSDDPSKAELDRLVTLRIKTLSTQLGAPQPSTQRTAIESPSAADRLKQEQLNQERREAEEARIAEETRIAEEAQRVEAARVEQERQTAIQGQRVNEIINLLETGAIQDPTNVLGIIQRRFGIGTEDAQEIFNVIRNQRQRLLEQQGQRDVFLRGAGEAFGRPVSGFTPFGQGALSSAFGRFQDINPITNFFPQQEQGQAFQGFLGAERPTQSGLQTNIDQILAAFNANPTGPQGALFNATFSTPQQAASAAAQPFLAGVAPRLRSSLGGILQNQFASQFALNPEQFQTPQQIAGIFNTFKNQGF